MRTLLCLLALLCSDVFADPLPSALSGWYRTPYSMCRLILSRGIDIEQVKRDLLCTGDDGNITYAVSQLYSPGCPDEPWTTPFHGPNPEGRAYAIRGVAYGPGPDEVRLSVITGTDRLQLANGIGAPEIWTRLVPLLSPRPYTCAGATGAPPAQNWALYCRRHPSTPACGG